MLGPMVSWMHACELVLKLVAVPELDALIPFARKEQVQQDFAAQECQVDSQGLQREQLRP